MCAGGERDKFNLSEISYLKGNWSKLSPLTQKSS